MILFASMLSFKIQGTLISTLDLNSFLEWFLQAIWLSLASIFLLLFSFDSKNYASTCFQFLSCYFGDKFLVNDFTAHDEAEVVEGIVSSLFLIASPSVSLLSHWVFVIHMTSRLLIDFRTAVLSRKLREKIQRLKNFHEVYQQGILSS